MHSLAPSASVLLISPKYAANVGTALRACALLGGDWLFWTGDRVPSPDDWPEGVRLPREERMRCYRRTRMTQLPGHLVMPRPIDHIIQSPDGRALVPVCIEIVPGSVDLREFEHPDHALYVFGPEDGEVPKGIRHACHHFVRIPNAIPYEEIDARTPFNLSAAISIVLYDRLTKARVPAYA